jgi:hypothetical protein
VLHSMFVIHPSEGSYPFSKLSKLFLVLQHFEAWDVFKSGHQQIAFSIYFQRTSDLSSDCLIQSIETYSGKIKCKYCLKESMGARKHACDHLHKRIDKEWINVSMRGNFTTPTKSK